MTTRTGAKYLELAEVCKRREFHLELAVERPSKMELRVVRAKEAHPLRTSFALSHPDAAAKRLLDQLGPEA